MRNVVSPLNTGDWLLGGHPTKPMKPRMVYKRLPSPAPTALKSTIHLDSNTNGQHYYYIYLLFPHIISSPRISHIDKKSNSTMKFYITLLALASTAMACTPGTFQCLGTQQIGVCNSGGEWVVAAPCGRGGLCDDGGPACRGGDSPYCFC